MTTRIGPQGPQSNIGVQHTAHRTTPQPARPFNALLNQGANAVVAGAEAAASKLPGGPMVVAAVRDSNAQVAVGAGVGGATSANGAASATGAAAGGQQDLEGVLARQTEDSLYFLQLQQQIQQETRSYQAVSNVLKARHDSVKNAIGNLR